MKAQPLRLTETGYEPCEATEATHICLNVPGPIPARIIPVMQKGKREGTGNWTWNGNVDAPTLRPSVLTRMPSSLGIRVCHSFIKDGQIQFLADCSHEFAGKIMDLLEVDW